MRQAVVIIHGIGEQWPMSTLRGFVKAVVKNSATHGPPFYSKPDRVSDTLELRRLTANKNYTGGNPTDFYELYWQHLMTGTTFAHIQAWLWKMLWRPPRSVPSRLRFVWWLAWIVAFVAIVGSLSAVVLNRYAFAGGIGAVVLLYLVRRVIRPRLEYFGLKYVGDAARYLSPFPENVAIRHAIRSAGLDLLRGLHFDPLRRYDRIIVVGHSLGSVIAYDVLTYLWQEMHSKIERSLQRNSKPQLEELEEFEKLPSSQKSELSASPIRQPALEALLKTLESKIPQGKWEQSRLNRQYRQHQRELSKEYWEEYKNEELGLRFPWRITDLVTLGSPLTHAGFLLADTLNAFIEAKDQREFPTCPPRPEDARDDGVKPGCRGLLKRVLGRDALKRGPLHILHHGALFACTRWTNLYFPGDIIGGPLASFVPDPTKAAERVELFGWGVRDVKLKGDSADQMVSHVYYWAEEEKYAVAALRAALNLGGKGLATNFMGSKSN